MRVCDVVVPLLTLTDSVCQLDAALRARVTRVYLSHASGLASGISYITTGACACHA